jgi:hypothetical protein
MKTYTVTVQMDDLDAKDAPRIESILKSAFARHPRAGGPVGRPQRRHS